MAVYRLFPEKDTFIFTENVNGNAGLDEILEMGGYPIKGVGQSSRILIQFNLEELQDVINNKASANYSASLNLKLAHASEVSAGYTVYSYPIYGSWVNGIGKFDDIPANVAGVGWSYRTSKGIDPWLIAGVDTLPSGVTGSHHTLYPGGGNWYTGSNGINLESSQTFPLKSNHDISLDVKNAVDLHFSTLLPNNGFVVKLDNSVEFNTTSSTVLKYFGADTNTIYPPFLEISWNDAIYDSTLSELSTDNASVFITNNKGEYLDEGIQRFRISSRPTYPKRTFTTGSIYKTNYKLPEESYWGLQDVYTEEMLVDFSKYTTRISADNKGSYFDVYMDGLQPERFYRIMIKTKIDGSTVLIDNDNIFKVVRNV